MADTLRSHQGQCTRIAAKGIGGEAGGAIINFPVIADYYLVKSSGRRTRSFFVTAEY